MPSSDALSSAVSGQVIANDVGVDRKITGRRVQQIAHDGAASASKHAQVGFGFMWSMASGDGFWTEGAFWRRTSVYPLRWSDAHRKNRYAMVFGQVAHADDD